MDTTTQQEDIGLLGRMLGVFHAPRKTFTAVRNRQDWLDWFVPSMLLVAATIAATSYLIPVMMKSQPVLEQLEEMPGPLPPAETMQSIFAITQIIGIPFTIFSLLFVGGLIIFLGARFALGAEVSYSQILAAFAYVSLLDIGDIAAQILPIMLRGEVIPGGFSLAALLPKDMSTSFIAALLANLGNPFFWWKLYLGSIALALIGNISLRKAAIGVFGLGIIARISTAAFTWMMSTLTPNLPA